MKRIGITSKLAPRIRHTGPAHRLIAPEVVASALEGDPVGSLAEGVNPVSLVALRNEIGRRLTSTGGRPSLEGTERRQKVPLDDQDWTRLCVLADRIAVGGPRPTPGQVASALLRLALTSFDRAAPQSPRGPAKPPRGCAEGSPDDVRLQALRGHLEGGLADPAAGRYEQLEATKPDSFLQGPPSMSPPLGRKRRR